ncbi:MAG: VOC family protein [Gammaproteobacteria bacterium]|nr:VOC family protein [Gammaproteobacteria bacterium]
MFKVKGIDHIVLRTTQPEKMLDFYCNILGGHIEKEQPKLRLTQLRFGESLIDIVEVDEQPSSNPNLDHFCLRIDPFSLDSLTSYFEKHGITINDQGPRYGAEGTGYSIYINDPENNTIELKESAS